MRLQDWSNDMAWQPHLLIRASTYKPLNLFGTPPIWTGANPDANLMDPAMCRDSPSGLWRYACPVLPKGVRLYTWFKNTKGTIQFNDDIIIPALYVKDHEFRGFCEYPFMSISPAEIFSLRPGIKMAHGHAVVAGLGLGHVLIEISNNPNVERITLVEMDNELVEWIMPVINPHLNPNKPITTIVGDAYKVLPTLKADYALVDIFKHYGIMNQPSMDHLRRVCTGIPHLWGWGPYGLRRQRT